MERPSSSSPSAGAEPSDTEARARTDGPPSRGFEKAVEREEERERAEAPDAAAPAAPPDPIVPPAETPMPAEPLATTSADTAVAAGASAKTLAVDVGGSLAPLPASRPASALAAREIAAEPSAIAFESALEPEHDLAVDVAEPSARRRAAETSSASEREPGLAPLPLHARETDAEPAAARLRATHTLAPPRSSAEIERAAEILRQVDLQLSQDLRQATIHLRPPELGRISIQMTVEEGRVSAVLRAEKTGTLDVLSRHLPELRASLEHHGIVADEIEVALGFDERGSRPQDDAWTGRKPRSADDGARAELAPLGWLARASSALGIDVYA